MTDTGVVEVAEEELAEGGAPIEPGLGRRAAIVGGAAVVPLVILTGLNFVEQQSLTAHGAGDGAAEHGVERLRCLHLLLDLGDDVLVLLDRLDPAVSEE